MVVDAAREFRAGFDELDRADVAVRPPPQGRRLVRGATSCPTCAASSARSRTSTTTCRSAPPPTICSTTTSSPIRTRRTGASCSTTPATAAPTARQHAIYHPLLRGRRHELRLLRLHAGRSQVRPHRSTRVDKEVDFAHVAADRPLPAVQRRRRRRPLRAPRADRSAVCLEDFAPYAPSGGAPIAFMAAPVIDQGVVIGVLIAQLSIEEIDNVVTGDRRWRQDGFGATGEAYLVGPDHFVRSGPRAFYENPDQYFAELKQRRRSRTRTSTPSAATARRCCTSASRPRPPGPLSPASRAPARSSAIAASRRSPPGGRSRFPASSGR